MVKARKYVLVKPFEGAPKLSNFDIQTEELPEPKDGEFLTEAVFLSVDPYMRAFGPNLQMGITMIGDQVAKVIVSKNDKYPVGTHVVGHFGWRSHTLVTEEVVNSKETLTPVLVPDFGGLPLSLALGVLGMPGNTSYFGFLEICHPKAGETVLVTGAAGAVGSHVGQIAKIKGCKVIGIAGSNEKIEWLKTLGFDHVINYKTENINESLSKVAPEGIDCYFDNVGGEMSSQIITKHMNHFGRISVCGSISSYNDDVDDLPKATMIQRAVNMKELKMEGFMVSRWKNRWMEGVHQNLKWIQEGKLVYREHVTEGFDKMVDALNGILKGENTGKAIVKV